MIKHMGLNSKVLLEVQCIRGEKAITQYIAKCIDNEKI